MKNKIIIGTRSSKLALWQAEYIARRLKEQYPQLEVQLCHVTTKGDKILDVPLAKIGGKGLFTKEIEVLMLEGKIDIAVHSLKDMPTQLPAGLCLAAITQRAEQYDAIVSNRYRSFIELPEGAKVGTSSLRRRAQLLHIRPDLQLFDLRGNVQTRLKKLDVGEYDAIILAAAGLERLGYGERISQRLPFGVCLPAVGQGALAVEAREDDGTVREMLSFLHDEKTAQATIAERSFLARVEGGCQVPVGVHGEIEGENLCLEAIIGSLDGKTLLRDKWQGPKNEGEKGGRLLAEKMLSNGGLEIMQQIGLLQGDGK